MVGRRLVGGSTTCIPLKINQSGTIPMISASSILYLPILYVIFRPQSGTGQWIATSFYTNSQVYSTLQFLFIVSFCYFYVAIAFNSEEVSDSTRKYGGLIPGIRAGKSTEYYLTYVLNRPTVPGSPYLAIISMIPILAFVAVGTNQNFSFGGISILIIVGVAPDTVGRIESQLQQRNYEGFLR